MHPHHSIRINFTEAGNCTTGKYQGLKRSLLHTWRTFIVASHTAFAFFISYTACRTRVKIQANRLDAHGEEESDVKALFHVTSSVIVSVEMCKSSLDMSVEMDIN